MSVAPGMILSVVLVFLYIVIAVLMIYFERQAVRRFGVDAFTVVLIFIFIYILVPVGGIHLLHGLYGSDVTSGNYFFDTVYKRIDAYNSLVMLLLFVIFMAGFYLLGGRERGINKEGGLAFYVKRKDGRILLFSALGFLGCFVFFIGLGSSMAERYERLILFRNLHELVERDFFSANAFALTQTFAWFSTAVLFCYLGGRSKIKVVIFIFLTLFFSVLMGSRRGFIFPVLILYSSVLLLYGRFYISRMLLIFPFIAVWVAYGKEFTGANAYGVDVQDVLLRYSSVPDFMLRFFADIGISQIESFAVLQNMGELPFPRFGIDHALSVLRRIPEGMIGLEINWPERIVRITTRVFVSDDTADIPPGLLGQSWLDFPFIGAFFWGAIIGLQVRVINRWARQVSATRERAALVVVLSMVVVLPINTGSYDYVFSIDMIFLFIIIFACFKIRRYACVGCVGEAR